MNNNPLSSFFLDKPKKIFSVRVHSITSYTSLFYKTQRSYTISLNLFEDGKLCYQFIATERSYRFEESSISTRSVLSNEREHFNPEKLTKFLNSLCIAGNIFDHEVL